MDRALCILDDTIKLVSDLEGLPERELIIVRRTLLCPECNGPAFFRKRTITGGAPCFGAKHQNGCSLASNQPQANETYSDRGSAIVVDFNFGANQPSLGEDHQEDFSEIALNTFQNETNEQKVSRRMSRLLKSLLYNETFRQSNREIIVERHHTSISMFFKTPLEALNHPGERNKYVVWGIISDAQQKNPDEALWLNFGGTVNDLSVRIHENTAEELKSRYSINDLEDLSGVGILAIGYINKSTKSEKVYVKIDELKCLSIRREV